MGSDREILNTKTQPFVTSLYFSLVVETPCGKPQLCATVCVHASGIKQGNKSCLTYPEPICKQGYFKISV